MATTTNYGWTLPTVGGSDNTWGNNLNANWSALDALLGGVSATEFEILDGAVITTAELNYLDGATGNIQSQIDSLVSAGGANNSTITIAGSTGVTGGGSFTLNQASNATVTVTGVTQTQAAWEAGTSTTEGVVSPEKVKAAVLSFSLGGDQTWQDVTASRALSTTYTNTTGKPICVLFRPTNLGNATVSADIIVDGLTMPLVYDNSAATAMGRGTMIIPTGATYSITSNSTISGWWELR